MPYGPPAAELQPGGGFALLKEPEKHENQREIPECIAPCVSLQLEVCGNALLRPKPRVYRPVNGSSALRTQCPGHVHLCSSDGRDPWHPSRADQIVEPKFLRCKVWQTTWASTRGNLGPKA